jgi:hypothetical protein
MTIGRSAGVKLQFSHEIGRSDLLSIGFTCTNFDIMRIIYKSETLLQNTELSITIITYFGFFCQAMCSVVVFFDFKPA